MEDGAWGGMSRRPSHAGRARLVLAVLAVLVAHGVGAPAQAGAQVHLTGEWRLLPQRLPINPIHVALLRTGRVLVVSGSENDPTVTTYRAAVWDPGSGSMAVQDIPWDLFCNGMSFLPDGRVLTTGGNLQYNPFRGIRTTTVFDPVTEQFSQLQDMARGRWYPSNLALGDGRTMTFSGWLEGGGTNNAVELYSVPGGWSPERFAPFTPPLYPWLHLLPDGRVFQAGAGVTSHVFHPATQTWTTGVATTNYPDERTYGSSVLLPLRPGEGHRARIMIMGGDNPATATAEIIDLSQPAPAWRTLPPMSAPRIQMNAVLLPTGKVLALGGSAQDDTASTASLGVDLFDPDTETWTPAGTMARPRMYHSVALLMPDATVVVAGSNPQTGTWDDSVEAYRPAYLFTASGALAPRPAITTAPAGVGYGAAFQVTTANPGDIASVALMRPGSSTHAFDFEQRLVNLAFTPGAGTTLNLTAPPSANVAPPGYYMLFLVNRAGVPSVATWMQLTPTPGNQPPQGTITAPAGDVTIRAGESVTFAGSGSDANGTVTGFTWSFPGGTPSSSSAAAPGAVRYAAAGTYDAMLVITDNAGTTDPSPPRRRITVLPTTLTASFTAPAAGATVSGTQPVGMTVTGASGATTFTLAVDGTQVFTTTTTATTATFDWDTRAHADGAHTLALTVRDATGATATATRGVTVNNAAAGQIGVSFPNLSPGQTVRGLTTVRITAAGTSGTSNRFAITVDGVAHDVIVTNATTVDWPWNTTGLTNGSHTISAGVTDATGRSGAASLSVVVQNTLRVFITSPALGATVSGTTWVNVWVEGVSGASNVFTLSVGGLTVASATATGRHATLPWDTTRTPNGPRTLVAQVRDAANNGGQDTRAVTVQNASSGPAAAFTSPAAGATVSGTVSVGLAASGGTAPYTYRLTIDGTQVFTTTTSATAAAYAWNTTTAANGGHALALTITDAAGASATATRAVTVANATGTLQIFLTTPAAGATVSGTVWVNVWVEGAVTGTKAYTMTVGGATLWTESSTATHVTLPWTTTSTPNGLQTLTVDVRDAGGNTGSGRVTVTVQNGTSPSLGAAFSSPAAGATVGGTVSVGLAASGGRLPYTYRLAIDGTPVFTTTTSAGSASFAWNTTTVANGGHTLSLIVTDADGATATATRPVTVSNLAGGTLQVTLTSPSPGSTVSGTVWVNIWLQGAAAGSKDFTMTVGGTTVWSESSTSTHVTLPWVTTSTQNGSRTLVVTVRDAAGASGTASVAVTVQNP